MKLTTKSKPSIQFTVLTLFPELIQNYLGDALLSKAIHQNLIKVNVLSLRNYSEGRYKSADDVPYGGGDGMVLKASVLENAIEDLREKNPGQKKVIFLSPQGQTWNHKLAREMAHKWRVPSIENVKNEQEIILICGRYAGIDQRFIQKHVAHEISIGDYVLSGGELAALVVIESISRYVPGVLGDEKSSSADSFENNWLEAPQFTKPQVWSDQSVPEVLTSGNHQKIAEWKKFCSYLITFKKRPDLFQLYFQNEEVSMQQLTRFYQDLSDADKKVLQLENLVLK